VLENTTLWQMLVFVGLLACSREPAPPGAPSAPDATDSRGAAASTEVPADLVRELRDRQRCNLLNGCAPEDRLVALGPGFAGAVCALYEQSGAEGDRYWRSRVLAALGRRGGPEAVACLRRALASGRWLEQATAAFALADLGATSAVPDLEALLSGAGGANLAVEAGARAALHRLGRPVDLAPLWARLAVADRALDQWPMLRFVIQAARVATARDQAPAVARLLTHPDYYTRREALLTLAALGDPGTLDAVAAVLDDPLPGIRRAAADALAALVPGGGRLTPEQWRTWRDARAPKADGGRAP
jgi:hypothetical protein